MEINNTNFSVSEEIPFKKRLNTLYKKARERDYLKIYSALEEIAGRGETMAYFSEDISLALEVAKKENLWYSSSEPEGSYIQIWGWAEDWPDTT
jgi:hypothetical protein